MTHDIRDRRDRWAALQPVLRRPLGVVALVGVLLVAVPGVLFAGDDGPGRFDRWVQSGVDGAPLPHAIAVRVDAIGHPVDATVVVAALAVLCVVLGRRRLAMVAVAGTAMAVAAATVLKPVVDRSIHGDFLSYPSGHTALATAVGVVLGLLLISLWGHRRHRTPGWLAATLVLLAVSTVAGALMAWSQITLGAHYPTDAIGGFGAALAAVPATAWLIDQGVASLRRLGSRPPAP